MTSAQLVQQDSASRQHLPELISQRQTLSSCHAISCALFLTVAQQISFEQEFVNDKCFTLRHFEFITALEDLTPLQSKLESIIEYHVSGTFEVIAVVDT